MQEGKERLDVIGIFFGLPEEQAFDSPAARDPHVRDPSQRSPHLHRHEATDHPSHVHS